MRVMDVWYIWMGRAWDSHHKNTRRGESWPLARGCKLLKRLGWRQTANFAHQSCPSDVEGLINFDFQVFNLKITCSPLSRPSSLFSRKEGRFLDFCKISPRFMKTSIIFMQTTKHHPHIHITSTQHNYQKEEGCSCSLCTILNQSGLLLSTPFITQSICALKIPIRIHSNDKEPPRP